MERIHAPVGDVAVQENRKIKTRLLAAGGRGGNPPIVVPQNCNVAKIP